MGVGATSVDFVSYKEEKVELESLGYLPNKKMTKIMWLNDKNCVVFEHCAGILSQPCAFDGHAHKTQPFH